MKTEIVDIDFKLLQNIEICCRQIIINLKIIAATENLYVDTILTVNDDHRNSFWATLRNNTLCMSLLRWNNIFGTYSEPTHWSKIPGVEKELVKEEIYKRCGIDEHTWKTAHKRANDLRNHFIAHNKFDEPSPNAFKDSEVYYNATRVLRNVVLSIFLKSFSKNVGFDEYIKNITRVTNNELEEQATNMSKQGLLFAN